MPPTQQDNRTPEEKDNPGQKHQDRLVNSEPGSGKDTADSLKQREDLGNPDSKDNQPAGDASDPRGGNSDLGAERSFYTKSDTTKRTGFLRGPSSGKGGRRKRVFMGVAVFLATIAASVIIFLSLLPLKILHIVNNLQDRFYATSQTAVQNETDNLLKQYITQHVLPSYKSCGTTISKDCSVSVAGTNPVTNLYKTWANARLENKLATDYGIEFQKRADGWYLKTPSTSGNGINIGEDGEKIDSGFEKAGISDIRQAVQDETKWYQVYFRFKVGSLLKEKYGIRRFIPGAALQTVADQKIAAKLFLVQRVIIPRDQTLGIALECLLSDCAATETEPTDATAGVDGAEAGAPENPDTDTAIRNGLTKLAAKYNLVDSATGKVDSDALDALVSEYTEISEKGFQNYLITEALTPIIGDFASSKVSDSIPYAGWINLASQFINAANDSSGSLKKISYITNATAAVALFSMYRTYADEIKVGDPNINATEVGSFTDSLGPGDNGPATDPEVGGDVGAEGSPIYGELIDGQSPSGQSAGVASSLLSNPFGGKVLADTTSSSSNANTYLCNNGKPVPAGDQVCPEETLGIGNHYADLIHEYLNNNPLGSSIVAIAQLWKSSIGQIFNFLNDIVGGVFKAIEYPLDKECDVAGSIPGGSLLNPAGPYCSAKKAVQDAASSLVQAVTQWLIPDPFSSNMSGGRTFDMMAAGADVAGNDSAHTTLGGQQLSDQQTAAIVNQQYNEEFQEYKNESFFARLTDTNSNYSPVSRLAMSMPTSWSSGLQSAASIFSNPLGKLGHVFSSIFYPNLALAASAQPDPFGVTQYGYPAGSIPSDPETYWNQNCSDNAAYAYQKTNSWNETAAGTLDSNEMPDNKTVNPCLLIMATTGSDGGLYDSSLLTPDDLADNSASTQPGNPGEGTGSLPTGTSKQLAQQLVPYVNNGTIKCAGDGEGNINCSDITNTAKGVSIKGGEGCEVDALQPALLGMMLELVKMGHTFTLSAICSDHHDDGLAGHAGGRAADFNTIDGVFMGPNNSPWTQAKINAATKLDKDIVSFMPAGSVGFGQVGVYEGVQCHASFSFLNGYDTFPDDCTHQHVQVEGQ